MVLGLKPLGNPTTWEKTKVFDRTGALYGPRTQAYGEINYLRKTKGFGRNQGIVWTSDSSLWGNQLPVKNTKVLDRTRALYGPRTQAYGETNYLRENKSFVQNRGIVWSSDSCQWGNQLPENKQRFWTEPRHCMVLGLKPMGKPTILEKTKVLDRTRALYGPRTQAFGETNYLRINKGFGQNQGIV